jgi:hypothetical protein
MKKMSTSSNLRKQELFKVVLLTLLFILPTVTIIAQHTLTIDDVSFDASTGTINYYSANYTDIIIPETFNVNGEDVEVTAVGFNAFYGKSLTNVTIPNSVTTIGDYAFNNNSLTNIVIPNSVKTIGRFAFKLNSLISVTIPNSVIRIGDAAFNNNAIIQINGEASNGIIYARDSQGNDIDYVIVSYGGTATEIDFIPSAVTIIGSYSFSSNSLTNVILPDNLTNIGTNAFSFNSLTAITIPATVTTISGGAFNNNAITQVNGEASNGIFYARNSDGTVNDTTIVSYGGTAKVIDFIPNTVTDISAYSFSSSNITSITLPNSIISIGYYAFSSNDFTTLTLPNQLKTIGANAFARNYSLTSIIIPSSVTTIGEMAFYWNSLTSVTFEQNSNIQFIGKEAFNFNSELTGITLPSNVSEGFTVYEDYNGNSYNPGDIITDFRIEYFTTTYPHTLMLEDVSFSNGAITEYYKDFTNIIIPTYFNINGVSVNVTTIRAEAFKNKGLSSVTFRDYGYLRLIGSEAFNNNPNLTKITLPQNRNNGFAGYKDENGNSYVPGDNITDFAIPYYAQLPTHTLTVDDVYFSQGSLGEYYGGYVDVLIPVSFNVNGEDVSITTIGEDAFKQKSLINVSFEQNSSIRLIVSNAFSYNPLLTGITLPTNINSGFAVYKDETGNDYAAGDDITDFRKAYYADLPLHTLTLDDVGFSDGMITEYHGGYTNIIIPESFIVNGEDVNVTIIAEYAFNKRCLENITLNNGLNRIMEAAFEHNILNEINIPDGVASVEVFAFHDNQIARVTIPNSVADIGFAAFNRNAIVQMNGSSSNGIVYARNSDGSENKSTVVSYGGVADVIDFIPASVTNIGMAAFCYNSLTSVVIPNNVMTIGFFAFADNSLTSVAIPGSVSSIGEGAFNKNAIAMVNGEGSDGIIYARNSNGTEDNTSIVSYGGVSDDIDFIPASVTTIERSAFESNSLTSVVIPNSVITIRQNAFSYNSLTSGILGNGVETIEEYAFTDNSLGSITLPAPVIKEGYTFTEWHDENGNIVTEINNFDISHQAQFNFTGVMVSGSITTGDEQGLAFEGLKSISIDEPEGITLYLSGDITGTRPVNADGTYSFALNAGRSIVITPVKEGYSFSPESISLNNIQTDVQNQDFTPVVTAMNTPKASSFRIYPNPFSTQTTIEFDNSDNSPYDLSVYDMTGVKMFDAKNIKTNRFMLERGTLKPGMYIFNINGSNMSYKRVVIVK